MAYWTAGKIRDYLKNVPDDEAVAAWLMCRPPATDYEGQTLPTPEQWETIVDKWEDVQEESDPFIYEALLESWQEVCPDAEEVQ